MASTGQDEGVTASAAGLSRQKQVPIILQAIESNGGVAQKRDIYHAVEKEIGQKLSEQGRASLREVVNRYMVNEQYIVKDRGWRITRKGNLRLTHEVVGPKPQKTLPVVWNAIITEPNEILVELLIEETDRRCGFKPNESQVKTFLKKSVKEILLIAPPKIPNTRRKTDDKLVLPIGLKLHKKYKGKKFTSVTVANNQIRLDLDGNIYTLNQAALSCMHTINPDALSVNAWLWWKCIDPETGEEKYIKKLKKK